MKLMIILDESIGMLVFTFITAFGVIAVLLGRRFFFSWCRFYPNLKSGLLDTTFLLVRSTLHPCDRTPILFTAKNQL